MPMRRLNRRAMVCDLHYGLGRDTGVVLCYENSGYRLWFCDFPVLPSLYVRVRSRTGMGYNNVAITRHLDTHLTPFMFTPPVSHPSPSQKTKTTDDTPPPILTTHSNFTVSIAFRWVLWYTLSRAQGESPHALELITVVLSNQPRPLFAMLAWGVRNTTGLDGISPNNEREALSINGSRTRLLGIRRRRRIQFGYEKLGLERCWPAPRHVK
ncbi:hypothetical protein BD410DRAFT_282619 [Rickenella mellea]|uniref:Uncharacterized protein n=1 Tax=Rickenella mellea TaxID=50990 RepID=A0A4Y7Q356_9AGAM|nr:hypothetical protein BD410DRAFT_282619 [Rickenella mellea]